MDESSAEEDGVDVDATPDENCGWYMYDFANSPYYQVYVGPILPLLLKWLAEEAAWHHYKESNETAVKSGVELADLKVPVLGISAGSYPLVANVVTCVFQVLAFLSFSGFADYGDGRKRFLMILTWCGGIALILNIVVLSSNLWWLAGVLRILSGICFGLCLVFYNAFLPVLADAQPEVRRLCQREQEQNEVKSAKLDEMSGRGMMIGYAGGATASVICWLIIMFKECGGEVGDGEDECNEFGKFFWPNLCLAIVGIWWIAFAQISFMKLRPRPGPPLDDEGNMICIGWKQAWGTLRFVARYRNMMFFMISYFIYSDSYNTIVTVAPLILESSGDSNSPLTDVMMFAFLVPLVQIFGIFVYARIQSCFGMSTKAVLLVQLALIAVVSLAGGLKIISTYGSIGLYIVLLPYFLTLGSIQANSRSLFAELIPTGMEAAMFAFYEITDKGSNFIGTGISAAIHNKTGDYEGTFWYCLPAVLVAAAFLFLLDVQQGIKDAGKVATTRDSGSSSAEE